MSALDELVKMKWWQAHRGHPTDMDYIGILGSIDILKAAKELQQLRAALELIGDLAVDRDGNTGDADALGKLIDEIHDYARCPEKAYSILHPKG